jgi:FMN phosphatase YigB (HAD superfamily)
VSSQLDEKLSEGSLPPSIIDAVDGVETVLIDVGGVLASDSWEWLLLTPSRGLAARLGLDREEVTAVGKELWRKYSLVPCTAEEYWSEFGQRMSIPSPSPKLVSELEDQLIVASPIAPTLLSFLAARGTTTGIISDNVSFWYERQAALLELDRYISPERVYLSYMYHRNKKAENSLFEIAAQSVSAQTTLVIDDRPHNVERAHAFGFAAVRLAALPLPY